MYSITAIVAKNDLLREIVRENGWLQLIELDFPPFGMLPFSEDAIATFRTEWSVELEDPDYSDSRYLTDVESLLVRLSKGVPNPSMAFISAEYWGGSGEDFACVLDGSTIRAFRDSNSKWPNTNISMALKTIGVPEMLSAKRDAFDVLGLGKSRSVEGWLNKRRST